MGEPGLKLCAYKLPSWTVVYMRYNYALLAQLIKFQCSKLRRGCKGKEQQQCEILSDLLQTF